MLIYASRNYIDFFFGGKGRDLIGRNVQDLQQIPLEDRARIKRNLKRINRTGRELIDSNRTILADGSQVETRWRLVPIMDSAGEVVEIKAIGELMDKKSEDIPCGGKCLFDK